ncbi:MAG: four helix bundle protein [bacterium]
MKAQSYKDLEIYQKAHRLAIEVHLLTTQLPKFELFEEGSQIRRSSKSVATNIVEGFGRRRYKNEFIQFLTYAFASCDETQEHLDLLFDTKSLKDEELYKRLKNSYEELGRKIYNFIKAVELRHKPPSKIPQKSSPRHAESCL